MDPLPVIFIILALILTSGVFSLFENALISCGKLRMEKEKKKIYVQILNTLENPGTLLLSCRLWINILRITAAIAAWQCVSCIENILTFSYVWVIIALAFILSIITALLGDALPKILSRTKPEKIAAALFPPVKILSVFMLPLTIPALKLVPLIYRLFNIEAAGNDMTEDELRQALLEGEKSGIVESKERTMVEGVFYLGDRPVGAFMTHRSEIQWLDCNTEYNEIRDKVLEYRSQRYYPVTSGGPDEIIGAVYLEDIILDITQPNPRGLRAIMQKAQFVPQTMSALKAFEAFKHGQANYLFVMDEYGGLAGLLSVGALVEEIVGELSVPVIKEEPLVRQADGSLLADGTLNIDDAVKALSLTGLPDDSDFHTLAGFVLYLAGELPGTGDSYEYQGYRFIVKEMDGNRIDKLLIKTI